MSAIHAMPMTKEELKGAHMCYYTRKLRLESYSHEMHRDAEALPDIKKELEVVDRLYRMATDKLEEISND